MNRDNIHSASLGGGAAASQVFVEPRPASEPGDENSDLDADTEWQSPSPEGTAGETADSLQAPAPPVPREDGRPGGCSPHEARLVAGVGQMNATHDAAVPVSDAVEAAIAGDQVRSEIESCVIPPGTNALSSSPALSVTPPTTSFQSAAASHSGLLELGGGENAGWESPGAQRYQAPVISNTALAGAGSDGAPGSSSLSTADAAAAAAAAAIEDDEVGMISIIRGYRGITRAVPQSDPASELAANVHRAAPNEGSLIRDAPLNGSTFAPKMVSPALGGLYASSDSDGRSFTRRRSSSSQSSAPVHRRPSTSSPLPSLPGLDGDRSHRLLPPAIAQEEDNSESRGGTAGRLSGIRSGAGPSSSSAPQRSRLTSVEGPRKFLGRLASGGKEPSTDSWGRPLGARFSPRTSDTSPYGPRPQNDSRQEGEPGSPVQFAMPPGDTDFISGNAPGFAGAIQRPVASRPSGGPQIPPPSPGPSFMRPTSAVSAPALGVPEHSSTVAVTPSAPPLLATPEFTILECVVEMLKGSECLKRRNIFQVTESRLWLDPDMSCVRYRTMPKKGPLQEDCIAVSKVRKIKMTDREIGIYVDEKRSMDFILPTRERAGVWLSGLCCLVPARASVKSPSKYKHVVENRVHYDPLQDSWNGKSLVVRKRFKQYILLGSIGRGAFGKVKIALSRSDFQFYAVKVLSKSVMRKQHRSSAFERVSQHEFSSPGYTPEGEQGLDINEVNVMRKLDHPNVVKLYDTYDDVENNRLFLVLEYVANGPVMNSSKLSGAVPINKARVKPVFVDAVAGLMYLHSRGVVHRDFKPENLLLSGDLRAKISDFGSAKAYDERAVARGEEVIPSHSKTTVGTPAFTAPELCLSEKGPRVSGIPYAADIWSLGATLFYLWFGQAPFFAKSVFEMYDAICSKDVEYPEGETPGPLKHLLGIMLEKDPDHRASFRDILYSPFLADLDSELQARVTGLRSLL